MDDVTVFVGGIIPDQDIPALLEMGVASVFQPGASTTRDCLSAARAPKAFVRKEL